MEIWQVHTHIQSKENNDSFVVVTAGGSLIFINKFVFDNLRPGNDTIAIIRYNVQRCDSLTVVLRWYGGREVIVGGFIVAVSRVAQAGHSCKNISCGLHYATYANTASTDHIWMSLSKRPDANTRFCRSLLRNCVYVMLAKSKISIER